MGSTSAVQKPLPAGSPWRPALAVMAALPLAFAGLLVSWAPAVLAGERRGMSIAWVPSLDVSLSFSLDALSLLFSLLVTGIGALVILYSIAYMEGERGLGRYYASLALFMLAMLGVVTAANLLTLFVFWELTSISSYLLISFRHEEKESQESALTALLITGAGGLALLVGAILLRQVYGTSDLGGILAQPGLLRGHPYYGWVLGLVLLAAFTKSAQAPFHIWLPRAMVAPTPVSAYLHSATMVKAGLYLLLRLSPVLGGTAGWQGALLSIGTLSMLLGAWRALRQRDLKAILAYTTISVLGMAVALLGLAVEQAVVAALVLIVAHALYKGALFLVAGAIDHATGTRDVAALGGLALRMPVLAAFAALAAGSMAGVPLTFGFLAKEAVYASVEAWPAADLQAGAVILFLVAANACNVAAGIVLGYRVFFGAGRPQAAKPRQPSWLMLLPAGVLGGISWLLGLVPGMLDGVVASALAAALPESHGVRLQAWHGLTWPLALSAATWTVGGALYGLWPRLLRLPPWPSALSVSKAYDGFVHQALPGLAVRVTRAFQNGSLRNYLLTILLVAVLVVGGALSASGLWAVPVLSQEGYTWPEVAMAVLLLAAALAAAVARTRLGAIVALGAVGSLVTLVYVRFSAPDLALTQLLIESLGVILLLLVFHFLPPEFGEVASKRRRGADVAVAALVGLVMGTLVLVANGVQLAPSVAEYYVAQSLPLAHGRNVVNAIVADFRGFDTLGEITVLASAALGLRALLRLRGKGRGGRR